MTGAGNYGGLSRDEGGPKGDEWERAGGSFGGDKRDKRDYSVEAAGRRAQEGRETCKSPSRQAMRGGLTGLKVYGVNDVANSRPGGGVS